MRGEAQTEEKEKGGEGGGGGGGRLITRSLHAKKWTAEKEEQCFEWQGNRHQNRNQNLKSKKYWNRTESSSSQARREPSVDWKQNGEKNQKEN